MKTPRRSTSTTKTTARVSPVVLIHGWPLSGASWEKQTAALLAAGHRVITYDRRGFGRSSKPTTGYNYDTFAADLDVVLKTLDLRDVALVGFSMGTGEVTRYIGKYGTQARTQGGAHRHAGALSGQGRRQPEGVDREVFEGIKAAIRADRPAFLMDFLKNFYNYDVTGGKLVSDRVLEDNWNVAAGASAIGTLHASTAGSRIFARTSRGTTVPTLIIHGDADRILPGGRDVTQAGQDDQARQARRNPRRPTRFVLDAWRSRERRIGAVCGVKVMNTRLLMTLRVAVATPQSIGAVPHGTRRTVPITGGGSRGRGFADLCYLAEAPTGSSFERMESSSSTFAPRYGPTTAHSFRCGHSVCVTVRRR